MNYTEKYNQLIETRKSLIRFKGDGNYYERHHIKPKSLGGNNEKDNLILLTAKEHFVAHLLLTKMFEGKAKISMYYAFWKMCTKHNNVATARDYAHAKQLISVAMSTLNTGRKLSPEHIEKIRKGNLGKTRNNGNKHSVATKEKMSKASIGRKKSDAMKKNLSNAKKGKSLEEIYGVEGAKIQREKLAMLRKRAHLAQTGRPKSEETKRKISETLLKRRLLKIQPELTN